MEWTDFWCADINSGKLKVMLIIGPLSYEGSNKIIVACPSVNSAFFLGIAD